MWDNAYVIREMMMYIIRPLLQFSENPGTREKVFSQKSHKYALKTKASIKTVNRLLSICDLNVHFFTYIGTKTVKAVDLKIMNSPRLRRTGSLYCSGRERGERAGVAPSCILTLTVCIHT